MKKVFGILMVAGTVSGEITPDRVIDYKQTPQGTLTLHQFNPAGHTADDRAPAMIFFFGGGWKKGDPSQFYRQAKHLAARGMVVFCADYRTETRHGTTPRACVSDGRSAVRWVRGHADELGIDPQKILAGGGSAGGHIAAAVALLDGMREEGEDGSVSSHPAALILFNPVVDTGPNGFGHYGVREYWKDFSPLHNLDEQAPPTLMMHGTGDQIVAVATVEAYRSKMQELGVRCDLILYEGQPHGFFNTAKYRETVQAMDDFLVSLGYLPPAE